MRMFDTCGHRNANQGSQGGGERYQCSVPMEIKKGNNVKYQCLVPMEIKKAIM